MSTVIRIKRGNKADLPGSAVPGEPHITLDTHEVFFGASDNTVKPQKIDSENIIDKGIPNGVSELDSEGNVPHHIKTTNLFFSSATEVTIHNQQTIKIIELPIAEFRLCKWLINVTDQTTGNFYSCEILAHHNNITADFSEYGSIGEENVVFNVIVENTNMCLYGTSSKDNQIVRTITTAIRFN